MPVERRAIRAASSMSPLVSAVEEWRCAGGRAAEVNILLFSLGESRQAISQSYDNARWDTSVRLAVRIVWRHRAAL